MFARLVLPFYAIVSDAVFLVSSLYHQQYRRRVPVLLPRICGRSPAGAPQ
jgi:hypothetical protein